MPVPVPKREAMADDRETRERYHGFSLRQVTWGYRDLFARAIKTLFEQGDLGPHRPEVTEQFFQALRRSDQSGFDHVLYHFLNALNSNNRWLLNLPGMFAETTDTGFALADCKRYYGIRFFETLAAGGLGDSPAEMRRCLDGINRLRTVDVDLAMAYLAGFSRLSQRLRPRELDRYVAVALQIHGNDTAAGCRFLCGELASSEAYIRSFTQECRLADMAAELTALLQALCGNACEIGDLSGLDSDDLLDRGCQTVTLPGYLFLPISCRRFDHASLNRNWYLLCGIASASLVLTNTFSLIHGHPHYRTCAALAGDTGWRLNLFQTLEWLRALRGACQRWPGARRLIAWGLAQEMPAPVAPDDPRGLLIAALDERDTSPLLQHVRGVAESCATCFDVAAALDGDWVPALLNAWPALASVPLTPLSFLSDLLFPVTLENPPADRAVADLKQASTTQRDRSAAGPRVTVAEPVSGGHDTPSEEPTTETAGEATSLYDEWDFKQNDYQRAWCQVYQKHAESISRSRPPAAWESEARAVQQVFERLKPDLPRRETRLADGDEINTDHLVRHLVARRLEPSPPVRFYEKPRASRRDLAVLLLLDVSGSTGGQTDKQENTLDLEKRACWVLGQGLAALDDRFAVCGFSSNGREQCDFLIYKTFDAAWDEVSAGRMLAAQPRASTRMGTALRHAGFLLGREAHRQRLILLVTDGRPMDQGYDPVSRYAQHDVRMACEENARQCIHTFALSTEQNTPADMTLMFPQNRYALLPDIRALPRVLPRLYIQMTLS